ncbi:MAG: phosphonate ABC transporter ATP-binding protein [Clostridia bacterium]|nr:phosphonate ABC transporter ATP-binding protein [Clostridia bacterium]
MIQFDHVSKTFPNGVRGLIDVNLTINDGDFVSIIGLSGAGKSTLLRSINRLNEISEGNITIDGSSITHANKQELKRIRRTIGLISQQFNLVKRSTVQRNVLSGKLGYYSTFKSVFGLFSKEDYALCNEVLAKVELSDKLHERCDNLSGGQQQRVSIARTLFQEASIILADEPVASLDPATSQEILSELRKINTTMGKTVIVNIHSIALARQFSDRILALQDGKLVFDGKPDELTNDILRMVYKGDSFLNESER